MTSFLPSLFNSISHRAFIRIFLCIGFLVSLSLTACSNELTHMTKPSQWEKYGYRTHLQNSSDDD
ncbi:MAG: hypothetical protein J6P29_01860 [Acetobacter sp.]|nr:hypothetical protein [Acetobacter sp.]